MFPLYGNGSATFLRHLVRELVKKKHEVAIVSPDRRQLEGCRHYVVSPPTEGVFVGHPEWKKARKFSEMNGVDLTRVYQSYLETSIRAVKDFSPEIIHCFHTCFLPPVARFIKVMYGTKYIVTTHGSDLFYLQEDRRFVGLIKDSLNIARCVTAVSESTKRQFLSIFGYGLYKKVAIIPGGVSTENMETSTEIVDRKYNLKGKKVILFTGRLTKQKGVEYLIKAMPKVKVANTELFIVGEGPEEKNLKNLVRTQKNKNIHFLPYMRGDRTKEFHQFYKRAEVFVAPSIWDEPFGLVILEAMAYATPVIATKKGGITSIINDGQNGLLVRARNSKDLAEKINLLLGNEKLDKQLSENARQTILNKFSWPKIAERFEKIYFKYQSVSKDYLEIVKKKKV